MSTLQVRFATKRRTIETDVYGHKHMLLHRAVVGIQVQGFSLINFRDGTRWGEDPRVDARQVPTEVAVRLDEFVRVHYASERLGYNCFSFMRYITGMSRDSADTYNRRYTGPTISDLHMRPYQPYVMLQGGADGRPMHGIVGFTSTVSFSVIGNNQPLTMAPTVELMKVYDSDALIEVRDAFLA